MATRPHELSRLDTDSFEHLAVQVAMQVLGAGVTGFGPGPDGGRDGWYEGEAPYPSDADRWKGEWYIQAKFHAPHLSTNAQAWLRREIKQELDAFSGGERQWPDNWIIITNVDPSGSPKTGTHDRVRNMVNDVRPELANHTHIWGGQKILAYLAKYPHIASYFGGFTTSGQVLSELVDGMKDERASGEDILREFIVNQIAEQQFTKLDQAGSTADTRPGIQRLFVDLPYRYQERRSEQFALKSLSKSSAENFRDRRIAPNDPRWHDWSRSPVRSNVWFIRGGPGQGKSTLTQYLCQIQRASLIDSSDSIPISSRVADLVDEVKRRSYEDGFWPLQGRVPVQIELRVYAQWFAARGKDDPRGILSYVCQKVKQGTERDLLVGTLKRALGKGRWLLIFDGLDEVPGDVKDDIANEVIHFVDNILVETRSDALVVCTSRPQGYSGQFDALIPTIVDLDQLEPQEALACALPVLSVDRADEEVSRYHETLREALSSPAIREIMTTPLQSHIMAVVVRDGGRPPDRRWQLFNNFYEVIKKREANRNLPDRSIARLLREGDKLIKTLHNRLGFELHARAERSEGAQTSIEKDELRRIVSEIVSSFQESDIDATVETLMSATTDRLVLVSTPESGANVRFDIRPLQEFFAAEHLYQTAPDAGFQERLRIIAGDSHWREVLHFLLSALVEQGRRTELAQAVQVLIELDNPADDEARPLARSLFRGGIFAARLLREGVLEADKRVRHQFQPCVNALLAATDAKSALPFVGPPHSRDWLANAITEALAQQSPPENIGAAIISPAVMSSGDARDAAPAEYIIQQDANYRSVFINRAADDIYNLERSKALPDWFFRYAVRELSRVDWYELSTEALGNLYSVIGADPERTVATMVSECLPVDASEIIVGAFQSGHGGRSTRSPTKLFGVVSVEIADTPTGLASKWEVGLRERALNLPGVFGIIAAVAVASSERCARSFELLSERTHNHPESLLKLPSLIDAAFLDRYRDIDASDLISRLGEYVREEFAGRARTLILDKSPEEEIDWAGLCRVFPFIVPSYFEGRFTAIKKESLFAWLNSEGAVEQVVDGLMKREEPLLNFDLSAILHQAPSLGRALQERLSEDSPRVQIGTNAPMYRPFPINLPAEAGILPYLVRYLTNVYHRGQVLEKVKGRRQRASYRKLISDFIKTENVLFDILADSKLKPHVRASAGVLALGVCDKPETERVNQIFELITTHEIFELFPAVFAVLSSAIFEEEKYAERFVNMSLSFLRPDLRTRVALEPMLAEWREITKSPVMSNRALPIWH